MAILLPEQSSPYKTSVKTDIVQAMRDAMSTHPDSFLSRTKVSLDYPTDENSYPLVLVRFYERSIYNAGVGHVEYLLREGGTLVDKFRHSLYDGTIEFAIYALSTRDRDLLADSIIEILRFPDMSVHAKKFYTRLYDPPADDLDGYDNFRYNFLTINHDRVQGFGETQTQQPWLSEDQLQYQTSYRVDIYGEFYNLPPLTDTTTRMIEKVNVYPYMESDPVPTGVIDPSTWQ